MDDHKKLALRRERLSELARHELERVAGAHAECESRGCGACLYTVLNCGDIYTIATCTCPTGASCVCPTADC